ncbi:MAG: murein biosynthesis integral membrane protein MurJ [Chloroflexi bacterium]|nr:murein biosynthesis integral membrane protein MurJ [Chloroflexota bacterium]
MTPVDAPFTSEAETSRSIAASATIVGLGNITSRVLGQLRETINAHLFGASGSMSAFRIAGQIPRNIYELLVGGMVTAALVPVFSEYAAGEDKDELWHITSVMLSLAVVISIITIILLEIIAPLVAWLFGGGFDAPLQALTTTLIRLILPSLLFFVLAGIFTATLYAQNLFTYPALAASVFNIGGIACALLLASHMDVASLSIGVVLGAFLMAGVQVPGLRGAKLHFSLDISHPGLRRIIKLYAPVLVSLVISQVQIAFDYNWSSRTVEEAIAWKEYATRLIQFPLGLVSTAVSMAVLPTLSQIDAAHDLERFKSTLGLGLRLVLSLIIPATTGLFILAVPIVALLYQYRAFSPTDTLQTANALRFYLIGMPFAAIDLPLIFAFYSRKNTMVPVVVGILAIAIYLAVAPTLSFLLGWSWMGLVLANSIQLASHALLMLWFLRRNVGSLGNMSLVSTTLKSSLASLVMALVTLLVALWANGGREVLWLAHSSSSTSGLVIHPASLAAKLTVVGTAGLAGLVTYAIAALVLGIEEVRLVLSLVWRRAKSHPA